MKATLEFNLPKERLEFDMAKDGAKYFCLLEEVRELLRKYRKYEDLTGKTPEDVVEAISKEFYDTTAGLWD